ncbi:MAG: hypothetical protein HZB36_04130 [Candidatus Omnitrophica bacterium]|nr:hypothetical protein [Candidatus Omnitrophota bacterium]
MRLDGNIRRTGIFIHPRPKTAPFKGADGCGRLSIPPKACPPKGVEPGALALVGSICFLLLSIFVSRCYAAAPAEIFGNITYVIYYGPYEEKVKLIDGKYEMPGYIYIYYKDKYVYGDFNNDGLRDAAVLFSESGGGSGTFYRLAFLINDGQQLVHKDTCYLGDRVVIYSLKERQGKVFIDMLTHADGDCMAGPSKRVTNIYEYAGISDSTST